MIAEFLPLFLMVLLALGLAMSLLKIAEYFGPHQPNATKGSPYESGQDPVGSARDRYSVKFYLVAMIFIVFDIELIFFYPWAVAHGSLGVFGLVAILIFAFAVFESFIYLIGNGAPEWGPVHQVHKLRAAVSAERTTRSTIRRVGGEGRLTDEAA